MASPFPSRERRVARDEDTLGGVRVAEEVEMYNGADHGVGSVEGEGFAGMESDEYDLQEDGQNTTIMQRAMSTMGMRLNWKTIWPVSEECLIIMRMMTSIDIAFEFYQQYAKHHGFGARRSKSEKRGEVRIRQEFVCHRQGYRSPKFYSMPNRQRPRADTRCGCPARMLLCRDDESGRWNVAYFFRCA
ncbi:hypothetical protein AHAS_Ahas16G0092100 [Arachis hypogaea]